MNADTLRRIEDEVANARLASRSWIAVENEIVDALLAAARRCEEYEKALREIEAMRHPAHFYPPDSAFENCDCQSYIAREALAPKEKG